MTGRWTPESNVKTPVEASVIIVGAGLAGLACARRLMQNNISFTILEAEDQIGGRLKTENKIIQRFFKPFFAGVCLDPEIGASSRVFRYIYRVFAEGMSPCPVRE